MKHVRTGLSEGSLLYNDYLRSFYLNREQTEDNFINWLYTTSGWYDTEIKGSYFNIDTLAVRNSPIYSQWYEEMYPALYDCEALDVMMHDKYWFDDSFQYRFASSFGNYKPFYWKNMDYIKSLVQDKDLLVVNGFAPLIEDKYGVRGYRSPYTFFNSGEDKNSFETLERVISELPDAQTYLIAWGAYGSLLAQALHVKGREAIVIGSGLHDFYPLESIPDEFKPKDYMKIEDGRYFV
jgi:hypothetical protein